MDAGNAERATTRLQTPRVRPVVGARAGGFTLFELLAVVAMIGLLSAVALPNFGLAEGRAAHEHAKRLAAELELARARALATGEPHRLVLDVDDGHYWLERRVPPEDPIPGLLPGAVDTGPPDVYAPTAEEPLLLSPPSSREERFEPLPGPLGIGAYLPDEVFVAEVEQEGVVASEGIFEVPFASDGTTDPLVIRLASPGGSLYELTLPPWAGDVRIAAGS